MIDYMIYSLPPKCEHELIITSSDVKEFGSCTVCSKVDLLSKSELRSHLIDNHTKEGLTDLIVDIIY